MSDVKKLYSNLSDDKLRIAVEELKHAETTGVFGDDSIIRNLCRETAKITNMDVSSNLLMVQIGVLKEAAYRWIDTLPVEIEEGPSQAILELLDRFQPWIVVTGDEAVNVSLRIMDLIPIVSSNSLHIISEEYFIDGEIYRFSRGITSQETLIEKKPKKLIK